MQSFDMAAGLNILLIITFRFLVLAARKVTYQTGWLIAWYIAIKYDPASDSTAVFRTLF